MVKDCCNLIWKDPPAGLERVWKEAFSNPSDDYMVQGACPVCRSHKLRRYYDLHRERAFTNRPEWVGQGSLWEWCSNCRSYCHCSAFVPKWWRSELAVDKSSISHDPGYLDRLINEVERPD